MALLREIGPESTVSLRPMLPLQPRDVMLRPRRLHSGGNVGYQACFTKWMRMSQ